MANYQAPLRELNFVLNDVLQVSSLGSLSAFQDLTPDTVTTVLAEAARLIEEEIAPINATGDKQGCQFRDGEVATPAGYPSAYVRFVEGGWPGLSHGVDHGGQGLPFVLSQAVMEMLSGACAAFALYPMLTDSACDVLQNHGSSELQAVYLDRLVSGAWTGTMCLTEPEAGSDLARIRTRAVADGDRYRLHGRKIFITGGEHDLAENIIHLVLARLPDSPPGVGGISLFLVPKFLSGADRRLGDRNAVYCEGLEEKMGIHGASTCVMGFDGAEGWLVGEPNQGLKLMFTMMNRARLAVGQQGLGLAEAATQNAVAYALERHQGRRHKGDRTQETVPIIDHPDVRRMLLTMKAFTEGIRLMSYDVAMQADIAAAGESEAERESAADFVDLMTPVCKAFFTDAAMDVTSLGIQVYGGHGYIRDHGMEQYLRDAKITCLYEGTNGIQALDLVGRKLRIKQGRLPSRLFARIESWLAGSHPPESALIVEALKIHLPPLQRATAELQRRTEADPDWGAAVASDYLRWLAFVGLAWYWGRAVESGPAADSVYHQGKCLTAEFFVRHLLPLADGWRASVSQGKAVLAKVERAMFSP